MPEFPTLCRCWASATAAGLPGSPGAGGLGFGGTTGEGGSRAAVASRDGGRGAAGAGTSIRGGRWKTTSTSFLGLGLRLSASAGTSSTKVSARTWIARLVSMLRVDGAPDVTDTLLPDPTVVTKGTTSVGRDEFDRQIVDLRFREIDDAQDPLVVQAVVGCEEQHAPVRGPATQDLRHARGQVGHRDLAIDQGHATVGGEPFPCRRLEDAAGRGHDAQDHLRFLGLRGHGIGGGSSDVDVVALQEEGDDDHEDDQQHEDHVDERRDIDLGMQVGAGYATVELHDQSPCALAPARLAINPTPWKPACSITSMACRTSPRRSRASPRITTLRSGSSPAAARRLSPKRSAGTG